nr:hypothetical protein NG677_05110 [Methylobacterium sp. OTU13CASTA1]
MHQVGEVFRRLPLMRDLGEPALDRALHAVLNALRRVAHDVGERRARILRERTTPKATDIVVRVSRTLDADGWDPGDPE